jgi:hypothetical protein
MANVTAGMEKVARGIWYGVAPKIGSNALIIDVSHRSGAWEFDYQVAMAFRELTGEDGDGDMWFQCVEDGQWVWSHGLVDSTGRITQIG